MMQAEFPSAAEPNNSSDDKSSSANREFRMFIEHEFPRCSGYASFQLLRLMHIFICQSNTRAFI